MYRREVNKPKTAAKTITADKEKLKQIVLNTVARASKLVGSTLGPNGKVVLIERQENLPPFTTKDGITVFDSMAFSDPTAQAILEVARDSSSNTNTEAGDGTTTATILAEALIRRGFEYLEKNPQLSPQKIMRELEYAFSSKIVPFIKKNALRLSKENTDDLLRKVATIATNNDKEMADAVLESFGLVGYSGNITIAESPGSSGFMVEKVEGFPVAIGFEETAGRFIEEFINDKANYRIQLEKPWFILYNGKVNDIGVLLPLIGQIGEEYDKSIKNKLKFSPNVVLVAHYFSDQVLSLLASNYAEAGTLNVVPLKTPMNQQANSPYHFLVDLAAFTGAKLFDPITCPVQTGTLDDIGLSSMDIFECYRYKSVIFGKPKEESIITRVEQLEQQAKQAESILDGEILRERAALLSGGIARLRVLGSSEAELKEKRHRVEDAVSSIKGALKMGVLPGGGKTLLWLSKELQNSNLSSAVKEILAESLKSPVIRLLDNGGNNPKEISDIISILNDSHLYYTYDALDKEFVDAVDKGILDSASAVLMSIKNSLSVAKMLMTLSGIVVFKRDEQLDNEFSENYLTDQRLMEEAVKKAYKEKFEPPA